MNYRMIARILGLVLLTEAALLLISMAVALYYGESVMGFTITIGLLALIGGGLLLLKPRTHDIYAREGFMAVSFSWILMSLFGALPFVIEGMIPDYVSAVFETASGFTTTGASALTYVEGYPYGLLFWRSFTHWVGGMGVLVFIMAVLPMADDRSLHIMRAEVPGPVVGKLVPKAKNSAMILYGIYVFLTVLEMLLLRMGGMPLYDSVVHAFGSAGTGGFSIKNASIGYYNSAYIDIVISVFLLLFSINFNLYFFILLKNVRAIFKNEELRWFLCIVAFAVASIGINIANIYATTGEALRHSLFQVATIVSTAGYSTADFNLWPEYSRTVLVMLMFIGACVGSTGGGMKLYRMLILTKSAGCEVRRMMHPRSVNLVKIDGKTVPAEVVHNTHIFFMLYMLIIAASTVLIACFDECDFTTNFTAVVACISNIGPGLGKVGPMGNYAGFSAASKIVLTLNMLLGRLEIFPILMVFLPASWKKV